MLLCIDINSLILSKFDRIERMHLFVPLLVRKRNDVDKKYMPCSGPFLTLKFSRAGDNEVKEAHVVMKVALRTSH